MLRPSPSPTAAPPAGAGGSGDGDPASHAVSGAGDLRGPPSAPGAVTECLGAKQRFVAGFINRNMTAPGRAATPAPPSPCSRPSRGAAVGGGHKARLPPGTTLEEQGKGYEGCHLHDGTENRSSRSPLLSRPAGSGGRARGPGRVGSRGGRRAPLPPPPRSSAAPGCGRGLRSRTRSPPRGPAGDGAGRSVRRRRAAPGSPHPARPYQTPTGGA